MNIDSQHRTPEGPDGAELAGLLTQTMADFDTRSDALLADVFRTGRPQRRRRAVLSVAGTATAVAAVAGLGAYGLGVLSPPAGGTAVPAGPVTSASAPPTVPTVPVGPGPSVTMVTTKPSTAPSTSPSVSPSTSSSPTESFVDGRRLPARVAALYLTRLAPSGLVTEYQGQQSADEVYVGSEIDRGEGKVGLQINVQGALFSPGTKEAQRFYRCSREVYQTCSVTHGKDGSSLLVATQVIARGTPRQATTV